MAGTKRMAAIALGAAALLACLLGGCDKGSAGKTYSVDAQWSTDRSCAPAHLVTIGDQRWYHEATDHALTAGQTYSGELHIIDEGPTAGKFATVDKPGVATFTTGSTTVSFTRLRVCVPS